MLTSHGAEDGVASRRRFSFLQAVTELYFTVRLFAVTSALCLHFILKTVSFSFFLSFLFVCAPCNVTHILKNKSEPTLAFYFD